MIVLREALPTDLGEIRRLASIFDTVNLPNDPALLARVISTSRRSFAQRIRDPFAREYLFVAEDATARRVVGCSMVIAQHGTREAPHLYFDVLRDERYSDSLGKHFHHLVLRLGANYDGPTEIGGLILLPQYRGGPAQVGKQLSYVRFLYMAMHPAWFRSRVLSELLPPLEPDGRSLLWESLGKKFTGLTYQEADRISKKNKEFVRTLFPSSEIYASLFPKRVQRVIGQVGQDTKGVEKMLKRVGFQYSNRIDPFDGGPHYEADFGAIELIHAAREVALRPGRPGPDAVIALVGRESGGTVRFRAVRTECSLREDAVVVPPEAQRALAAKTGAAVWAMPIGQPQRAGDTRTSRPAPAELG